jgi:hypothetical protein
MICWDRYNETVNGFNITNLNFGLCTVMTGMLGTWKSKYKLGKRRMTNDYIEK